MPFMSATLACPPPARLNAYYFRQHFYTLVPRHLDEDFAWLADTGADAVSLAILEQDLSAAAANLDLIFGAAARRGLQVWAVPSRWGGLVAGAPKVPSLFAATHPETWAHQPDGRPQMGAFGPIVSLHHPAVRDWFMGITAELARRWPFAGLMWDEPKTLGLIDASPAARAAGAPLDDPDWHENALVAFLGDANRAAQAARPGLRCAAFLYSHFQDNARLARFAAMPGLDDFGCDGRPWSRQRHAPVDPADEAKKSLLDHAPAFIAAAAAAGRRPLLLIENHNLPSSCLQALDAGLPETLALGAEHVLFYYYPRNVEEPERAMSILRRHLSARARR